MINNYYDLDIKDILIIGCLNEKTIIKNLFHKYKQFKIVEIHSLKELSELTKKHNFFITITDLIIADSSEIEILELLKKENLSTIIINANMNDSDIFIDYSNIITNIKDDINSYEIVDRIISTLSFCENEEILIIEDSNTKIETLENILKKLSLKIRIAKNDIEALEILNINRDISIVICNFLSPNFNNINIIKRIRIDKLYQKIPIIVTVQDCDLDLKKELYKFGVNDILLDPILEEELVSKILNIFSNKKYIKKIESYNELFDKNIISSITDLTGNIVSVSDAFCEISGYSKDELLGKRHNIVRHPDMTNKFYKNMWDTIRHGLVWQSEIKNLKKNKDCYWVKATVEPIFSKCGTIIGYSSIRQDITDKKRIEILSTVDELTNVYNRRYFNEIFPKIINNAKERSELVCFLFIDIDNFKQFNDNYGHHLGDSVLIKFANCLSSSVQRKNDYVFRLGGEEFAIIYSSKCKDKAIEFAETILNNIRNLKIEHEYSDVKPYITASMGLVCKYINEINYDEIYKEADNLLYEAKRNGKNQIKLDDKIN